MAENGTLSQNQKRALAALLKKQTVRDAAKVAGLGERTLWRYLADDTFKAELRALQDRAINAATAALAGLTGQALDTLRAVLDDKKATHGVRIRAALGVLDHLVRLSEFADLEERIAALEKAAQER